MWVIFKYYRSVDRHVKKADVRIGKGYMKVRRYNETKIVVGARSF